MHVSVCVCVSLSPSPSLSLSLSLSLSAHGPADFETPDPKPPNPKPQPQTLNLKPRIRGTAFVPRAMLPSNVKLQLVKYNPSGLGFRGPRNVDIRLHRKGNSNSHGTRPVY